jgi:hypothetical protein
MCEQRFMRERERERKREREKEREKERERERESGGIQTGSEKGIREKDGV